MSRPEPFPEALRRPFRLIAFDWDGTAVASREEDTAVLRGPLERLLEAGVLLVVVTGTSVEIIDRQLTSKIRRWHRRGLFVAANRGSEVYGFGADGAPLRIWARTATEEEEKRLSAVAQVVSDQLRRRTGGRLETRVVSDRLNRRKIDLIPEWSNPPKASIGQLLEAVDSRLTHAGLDGGVGAVLAIAERAARACGLSNARITSDVKHVEIGLTDKGDAAAWALGELATAREISARDILVVGDEFGSVAGFPGSDHRMVVSRAADVSFVSVGAEPAGVPSPVIHVGGGPARFCELVKMLAALHPMELAARPTDDERWLLRDSSLHTAREHEIESLFAIANGYLGSRASLAEGSPMSAPATFLAGVYEHFTRPGAVPVLARAPDWTRVRFVVEGDPLDLGGNHVTEHRRILDLRQGILWRQWRHRDDAGRETFIREMRLASLADPHLVLQSFAIAAENWTGQLSVEASLHHPNGRATTGDGSGPALVEVKVPGSGVIVVFAMSCRLEHVTGETIHPTLEAERGAALARWQLDLALGETIRLDRLVAIHTTRDDDAPVNAAETRLAGAVAAAPAAVAEAHSAAWIARWMSSEVSIEGDPDAERAVRFATYHLVSTANPADDRVSIGARALSGPAYGGHAFWDTEVYMLPFFTATYPEAARALLMYRYNTLPAARRRAQRLGWQGALFAWESADTGEDVTPPFTVAPDGAVHRLVAGEQENHVSADVSYGVWSYWQATGDDSFLLDAGAEILLETSRFWASRVEGGTDGGLHIRRVLGPDEYHESIDDDAYTNGMASWNLERGAETAALMAARWPERWGDLSGRLGISAAEVGEWAKVAARIYSGFDPRTGLFEQFRGYFALEDIDLGSLEPRSAPVEVLLGRARIARSKVIKQADVMMLIALLWDRFKPEVRRINFRYYEPRTAHGSSLSPPVHALLAARLGDLELAQRYFRQTAEIDLANNMGNAARGIHAAALGGLWQAAIHGFAGLRMGPGGPSLDAALPATWRDLQVSIRWRGEAVKLRVTTDRGPQVASAGASR